MNELKKIEDKNYSAVSFSVSVVLHLLIFFSTAFLLKVSFEKSKISSLFIQVETKEIETPELKKEKIIDKKPDLKNDNNVIENEDKAIQKKSLSGKKQIESNSSYISFTAENSDTSNLEQIYKESTLGVTLKYPVGWTYVDQNLKNKLDGITFWSLKGNYSPPPYVHFEVKEKNLFDSNRFKYKFKSGNYTAYYNDPVELSGQISQIIYIRTENDEDFSIKLIMNGKEAFKSFQPEFFGMVKSFKFGKSFFK